MPTYNFSLLISQPSVDEEAAADKLYGGGCDDALFSVSGGVYEVEFDREAASLKEAILSAIRDVKQSGIGARVVRVLPDDLVNANAIADRSGKTRQAVRLWIRRERGQGFPAPRARVGKSPVWSWAVVAEWLRGRGELDVDVAENATVLAKINRAIETESMLTALQEGGRVALEQDLQRIEDALPAEVAVGSDKHIYREHQPGTNRYPSLFGDLCVRRRSFREVGWTSRYRRSSRSCEPASSSRPVRAQSRSGWTVQARRWRSCDPRARSGNRAAAVSVGAPCNRWIAVLFCAG